MDMASRIKREIDNPIIRMAIWSYVECIVVFPSMAYCYIYSGCLFS